MTIRNTRAGFTQAQFNDDASSLVIFEILLIAVIAELISLGAHLGAIEWAENIGAKD